MIKELFLPEQIHGRYLFPKRIIGIDIGRFHVSASQVLLKDTTIIIENVFYEQLDLSIDTYEDRVAEALKKITPHLDKNATIRTTISSSLVIMKELVLPFTTYEKISAVLPYDMENFLPFPPQEAIVDGIITHVDEKDQKSTVLAAAVQKHHIAAHLALLEASGIQTQVISIDFFEVYGLFTRPITPADLEKSLILIDFGAYSTRIAYIEHGVLRVIRTLSKGIINHFKSIAPSLGLSSSVLIDHIMRFGITYPNSQDVDKTLKESLDGFIRDLSFTIDSCTPSNRKIDSLYILGVGSQIQGFPETLEKFFSTPTHKLSLENLVNNPHVQINASVQLSQNFLLSIATALPNNITENINYRKFEYQSHKMSLALRQIVTALTLSGLLIVSFFGYAFWQTYSLNQEIQSSRDEVIETLLKKFSLPRDEWEDLDDLLQLARKTISDEQHLVIALSKGYRTSCLRYLLELSMLIDKDSVGLELDKLIITEDLLTIEGRVRDFEALKVLERELRSSKLFKYSEQQDDPNFSIKIPLTRSGELV